MEFVAAKCPNCAGDLRLPDDKKQVKCMYCGFDIIVREAINTAGVNVDNLLKLATNAEEAGNYAEAYKYFTQVLEFEPDNYVALLGKGINAGYLSTPDNFRSDELVSGVESAIKYVPDDKKEEIKLQTADRIRSVCSNYRISKEPYEAAIQRIGVIGCLELAHQYAPENEHIITNLYFQNHLCALNGEQLNLGSQSNSFDSTIKQSNQQAEEYLSKLQALNPDKATSLRNSRNETQNKISNVQATGGSGCLVAIICFLLVPIVVFVILI